MVAVRARLPYIRSSGYYRPFPPNNNQIMYEFAPLSSNNKHGGLQQHLHDQQDSTKTRATRDLEWREFDAFISGTDEPSCADLRRMWRLAKQLQQKALESNEISQQMHHNPFTASFKAENQKSSSPKSSSQSHHQSSRKKTKFSKSTSPEVEDPLEQSSDTSSTSVKQSRDRTSSSDIVYGVIKTHTSPQQEALPQVRDPTKEILRGLWGSSDYSSSRRGGGGGRRPPYHQYGRIQTHERPDSVVTPASPFQKLQTELYGPRRTGNTKDASENTSTYGTVHRFSPKTASSRVSTSSKLDQIRSMLNQESPISDNDNEISASSSSSPSKNAFDRIREKLMNTRVRERFRTARERNLRKKGSKKRRRNAEEVALIKERLLNNYIVSLPNYARSIDAAVSIYNLMSSVGV